MKAFIRMLLGVFGKDLTPSSQSEGGGSRTQSGMVTGPEGGTQGPGGARERFCRGKALPPPLVGGLFGVGLGR